MGTFFTVSPILSFQIEILLEPRRHAILSFRDASCFSHSIVLELDDINKIYATYRLCHEADSPRLHHTCDLPSEWRLEFEACNFPHDLSLLISTHLGRGSWYRHTCATDLIHLIDVARVELGLK